ncbi:MAG: hypothetical protein WCG27_04560 [Pseudomonadota bacterium]
MSVTRWIILGLCFAANVWGAETPRHNFEVHVFDRKVIVNSPPTFRVGMSVLIENKTLITLVGKIQKQNGEVLSFVSIAPDTQKTVPLNISEKEKAVFIPLAPSFQEIELNIGQSTYEIPPKR